MALLSDPETPGAATATATAAKDSEGRELLQVRFCFVVLGTSGDGRWGILARDVTLT